MSIGGSTEVSSAESVGELVDDNVSLRQRRGMLIKIVIRSSGRPMMLKCELPRVADPWDMKDIYSDLEDQLKSQAVIEGISLEESSARTLVKLFPELGQVDYEEAYKPQYRTNFTSSNSKVQVFPGNPTSRTYS